MSLSVQEHIGLFNAAVSTGADRGGREQNPSTGNHAGSPAAARHRLLLTAAAAQRRRAISNNGTYYGVVKPVSEETIAIQCAAPEFDGIVTRNHYGCLVLNAARTLFIDVDDGDADSGESQGGWRQTLDDLRLVLQSETDEGFRVYRTAAGFRLLATTSEFEPGAPESTRLMRAAGADAAFIELCAAQHNFRARLSPKPWRCGAKLPPNSYPRKSADEQQRFAAWKAVYERACGHRATCRFLGHIGPSAIRSRVAPIVDLHDRETKALQSLELA